MAPTGPGRLRAAPRVGGGDLHLRDPVSIRVLSASGAGSLCQASRVEPEARDLADVPAAEVIASVAVHLMSAAAVKCGLADDTPAAAQATDLDDALARIQAQPTGRLLVRGSNGSGKSSLLVALKARLGSHAFYWPTSDKLAFAFSCATADDDDASTASGFSSGERQLKSLQEIVSRTHAAVYMLDEWDANLDSKNRASAEALVAQLAVRAVVVEISHRDRV